MNLGDTVQPIKTRGYFFSDSSESHDVRRLTMANGSYEPAKSAPITIPVTGGTVTLTLREVGKEPASPGVNMSSREPRQSPFLTFFFS